MTKEEAVKEIEKAFEPAFANYIITALTEGATVSDKEPTIKNDSGVDCISRQAVDNLVWEYLRKATDENIAFYEHFLDLPSVTPQEPRKGHWKHIQYEETLCCSECGCRLFDEQTYIPLHYCPNCGAKMQEVKE